MDSKKIGLLLKELRIENNLTQEELANKLYISRQAISRWEQGKSIPDYDVLLSLSKIYNVSMNEILLGEKSNNGKISKYIFSIVNEKNRLKQSRNIIIAVLIVAVLLFSLLYLVTYFDKINIYEISGYNDELMCNDSLFVISSEKVYFKTCDLTFKNDDSLDNLKSIKYYYLVNGKERLISRRQDILVL